MERDEEAYWDLKGGEEERGRQRTCLQKTQSGPVVGNLLSVGFDHSSVRFSFC